MTKKIQPLSSAVVKKLRSGIALTCVAHCVEELVLNSIDAEASCIAVSLNLPFYQIQVVDNGCGIDISQMNLIGTRYATSKCHTLEDLQNLKSGGFRGEALSSLKEVSSVLMIESRAASSNETYCKIFTQGKSLDAKKSLNSRPSKGTTVTVYDFMYNMPVRKNSISEAIDFEECRKLLQSIALMHSNISFTLKNEASGEMSLQARKCSSLYHAFHQMFGQSKACSLKNVSYQNNEYEINGCISTDCHMSKDLQFLYVNKRRVLRTKIHKLINSILNKALSSRQKSNFNINNLTPDASSPSKNQSMCIFALNITCPYENYDIIFEPRKTMIEFSDWQAVLKLVEDSLIDFLKKEKIYSDEDKSETSMLNVDMGTNLKYSNMQDCKPGLFSNAVHRLPCVLKSVDLSDSIENRIKENMETEGDGDSLKAIDNNQEMSILSINKNINTSCKASSSMNFDRNDNSTDLESSACSDAFKSKKSVIDNLKSKPAKAITPNYFSTYSQETELGLPCRSVFPSKSPVMLRVPVKSTLSSLETSTSDSNFLKLKEKFQFLPRKERNYLSKDKKCAKRQAKVCLKVNNLTNTLTVKNNLLQSNLYPGFDKEKVKTKEHAMNLNHKSSQCPSVSSNMFKKELHKNVSCTNEVIRSDSKLTKDKSLQFPSEGKRIVSSYRFEKESSKLPLQSFRQSSRLERKNIRKVSCNEFTPTTNDLLYAISNDNHIPQSKKLRSSSCASNGNSDFDLNSVTESTENNEMDIEDLHSVRPDLNLNNIYSDSKIDNIPENISIDSTPEAIVISVTSESKFTNLGHLEFSTFDLRTFRKAKNINNSAQSMDLFSELDKNHKREKNKLLVDNLDLSSVDQVDKPQHIFPGDISVKENGLKIFDELRQERTNINLDCVFNSNCNTVLSETTLLDFETARQTSENMQLGCLNENDTENTYIEHGTMKENKIDVNILAGNSKFDSSYIDGIKDDLVSSNSNISKEFSLFDFQNSNILNKEKNAGILIESSPSVDFLQNQSECNVEKNVLSHKYIVEDYDSCNLLSGYEEKLSDNIDFVSNPFTEQLPSVSGPFALIKNSIEKNVLDSSFPEFSTDPPFTELLNMDQEVYNNNKQSYNETSNVEVSESKFSGSLDPNDIDPNNCKNVIEIESSINSNDDGLDMDINTLPISVPSDVKDDVNCNERNCDKSDNCMHHWKLCAEPKVKRKIYIDPLTGNSAYVVPKQQDVEAKQNIAIKNNNKIEAMLNEWDNPMFNIPYEAPSITENKNSQNVSQMYTFLNSYRFSKSTLSTLQVIGQVDCKFIACILRDFNGTSTGQRLLALFDQHAVHERIRLEELKKDLYETDKDGEKLVKTSSIDPPLQLVFNDEEIRLLHTYHEKIQQIGIYMNTDSKSNTCSVYSVPMCLVHKDSQELRRSLSDSVAILQNSIKEWLTSLLKTRSIPQVLPKSLLSVLNYQACRGAVKFGDPLSFEQCKDLLKSLSECSLPFQCAHGRPSIAPILDLKKIEVLFKRKSPPQLQTLHTNLKTFQTCDT